MGNSYVGIEHGELICSTLNGNVNVTDGEMIVMGVDGEFYPCKPDIFLQTYEDA